MIIPDVRIYISPPVYQVSYWPQLSPYSPPLRPWTYWRWPSDRSRPPPNRSLTLSSMEASLHTLASEYLREALTITSSPWYLYIPLIIFSIYLTIPPMASDLVLISLPLDSLTTPPPLSILLISDSSMSLVYLLSLSSDLSIYPIPLCYPKHLINPPLHIHEPILPLPLDLLDVPICVRFTSLGLVDGGVDFGPKFGPCLLQFVGRPLI